MLNDELIWKALEGALGRDKVASLRNRPLNELMRHKVAAEHGIDIGEDMRLGDAVAALGISWRKKKANHRSLRDGAEAIKAVLPRQKTAGQERHKLYDRGASTFRKIAAASKIRMLQKRANDPSRFDSLREDVNDDIVNSIKKEAFSEEKKNKMMQSRKDSGTGAVGGAVGTPPLASLLRGEEGEEAKTAAAYGGLLGAAWYGIEKTASDESSALHQFKTALYLDAKIDQSDAWNEKIASIRRMNRDFIVDMLCDAHTKVAKDMEQGGLRYTPSKGQNTKQADIYNGVPNDYMQGPEGRNVPVFDVTPQEIAMLDAIEARAPKPGGEGMASPEGGEAAQIRNIQEFLRQAGGGMGAAGGPEGGPAMPGNPTPEQPVVQGGQAPKTKKSPKGKSKEKAPKKTTSKGDKGNKESDDDDKESDPAEKTAYTNADVTVDSHIDLETGDEVRSMYMYETTSHGPIENAWFEDKLPEELLEQINREEPFLGHYSADIRIPYEVAKNTPSLQSLLENARDTGTVREEDYKDTEPKDTDKSSE